MATIEVQGEKITFPVGDNDRRQRIYFLKNGLNNDKEAMEMFMGGKLEEWFFVGVEKPVWLHILNGKAEIIRP